MLHVRILLSSILVFFVVDFPFQCSAAELTDSCAVGNPCVPGQGECVGLFQTPRCICQPDYSDDNCSTTIGENTCTDAGCSLPPMGDACASSPCLFNATCVNWFGNFKCLCDRNSYGEICETAEVCQVCASRKYAFTECAIPNDLLDLNSTRIRTRQSYKVCTEGVNWGLNITGRLIWVDDGCRADFCTKGTYNPCLSNPCPAATTICINGIANYTCQPVDTCLMNPCQNNATCTQVTSSTHVCNCTETYTGTSCESLINPCDVAPCLNNGTCTPNGPVLFTCACTGAWTGDTCEIGLGVQVNFGAFLSFPPTVQFINLVTGYSNEGVATLIGTAPTATATYTLPGAGAGDNIEIFVYNELDDNNILNQQDTGYRIKVNVSSIEPTIVQVNESVLLSLVKCPIEIGTPYREPTTPAGIAFTYAMFCYIFTEGTYNSTSLGLGMLYGGLTSVLPGAGYVDIDTLTPITVVDGHYLVPGRYSFKCAFTFAATIYAPSTQTIDSDQAYWFDVDAFDIGTGSGTAGNCDPQYSVNVGYATIPRTLGNTPYSDLINIV